MFLPGTCDARIPRGQANDCATARIRIRMIESAETSKVIVQLYQMIFVIYKQFQLGRSIGTTGIRFPAGWRSRPVPTDSQQNPARPHCRPAPGNRPVPNRLSTAFLPEFLAHFGTKSLRSRRRVPTGLMDEPAPAAAAAPTGEPTLDKRRSVKDAWLQRTEAERRNTPKANGEGSGQATANTSRAAFAVH